MEKACRLCEWWCPATGKEEDRGNVRLGSCRQSPPTLYKEEKMMYDDYWCGAFCNTELAEALANNDHKALVEYHRRQATEHTARADSIAKRAGITT